MNVEQMTDEQLIDEIQTLSKDPRCLVLGPVFDVTLFQRLSMLQDELEHRISVLVLFDSLCI